MAISKRDIKRAELTSRALVEAGPRATAARYDRRRSCVVVSLDNAIEIAFPSDLAEGLAGASPAKLSAIEMSPTGLGLHWPLLDADLYLPALLNGVFGSPRWMAAQMGKLGGLSRSRAKAAAARANGRRGGRPAKTARDADKNLPDLKITGTANRGMSEPEGGRFTQEKHVTRHFPKGLDGRMRDSDGEIRQKRSDTLVGTLRKEYGDGFAAGYRSDTKLGTVLKREGVETLDQLRKKC